VKVLPLPFEDVRCVNNHIKQSFASANLFFFAKDWKLYFFLFFCQISVILAGFRYMTKPIPAPVLSFPSFQLPFLPYSV
jgi:hypothetical protein